MNDDVMTKMPLTYEPLGDNTINVLRDSSGMNIYADDYLCENPWAIKGVEANPWIEVGKESLSEIIKQTVREIAKEKDSLVTPEIEKYHIKHR